MRTLVVLSLAGALLTGPAGRGSLAQTMTGPERPPALPVALTAGGTITFAPETDISGIGLAATATVRLSNAAGLGLALRTWWGGIGGTRCALFDDSCQATQETEVVAGIAHATFTAPRARWLYARAGLGLALVREQTPEGSVFSENRSWPLTLLGGVGANVELAPHVFVTPTLEVTQTFVGDDRLSSTPALQLLFGFGLTVG
ncbi:MAG: hypothetical protein GWN99_18015 [Gemmatimonadetes bacterium]|uniref:Outer membrane protein beta-barrel domain-containing protein n=1 Tax=Candidatus Kutchimonas denitrificans TaxID=3056748 RepID=A0AAE5C9M0_9BACT|nr:hypothetical protein [Gemmatimonadota bacterium]NIR75631.1 hypothetical protein [Candidatus Kutchimonas denitrificans]NIS02932.1 hypothetical protein [Gemmatimonadota bacterium]NIT68654.1 hypothetical protein [Gemmatimonadota bacterium]NIV25333.1 hypothetical protein [Gemmatimonadota bacterium]